MIQDGGKQARRVSKSQDGDFVGCEPLDYIVYRYIRGTTDQ
jgi:hypothetical protein